ncbi:MAG TPA: hypothetical protein VKT17_09640 [Acidobacteriota bacterium]|nr:hypothetical protein [Acidobacteriota bacterium]
MNGRLFLARLYLPAGLRRRKLEELLLLTARAFDAPPPALRGLSLDELLRKFAEFSNERAARILDAQARLAETERALFDGASRLGQEIRGTLRVSSPREAMTAARILYRSLGIDLRGGPGGEIVIRRCYFSGLYSSDVCRLMSSLDAGILSGLAGGGGLRFAERITEGRDCCRARFSFKEES